MREVALAKAEIINGLREGGVLVINGDDEYAGLWRELAGDRPVRCFGFGEDAEITALDVVYAADTSTSTPSHRQRAGQVAHAGARRA